MQLEILKFKGTHGPWKLFPIENHEHHHTYYKIGNSTTEDVRHATSVCNVTTRHSEQAEANAKLIAAAPDLLEFALDMIRRYPNSEWITKEVKEVILKAIK